MDEMEKNDVTPDTEKPSEKKARKATECIRRSRKMKRKRFSVEGY